MYTFFITIIAFVIAIVILVAVHEYGHFIVARLCNVKVLKFSLGFGPALFKKKDKHGTEYIIAPIPLGGYVKMLDCREDNVPASELKYEFTNKKPWQKLAIVAAGPFFNFILAFIAFYFMFLSGVNVERPIIYGIEPGSLAANAGMQVGEEVIAIDDVNVQSFGELQVALANRLGTSGDLVIKTKLKEEQDKSNTQAYVLQLTNWSTDVNKEPASRSLGIWLLPNKGAPLLVNNIINSNAMLADLSVGDVITKYNNTVIDDWDKFLKFIKTNPNTKVNIEVKRNKQIFDLNIVTGSKIIDNETVGQLGIVFTYPLYRKNISYGPIDSVIMSFEKTLTYINQTFYMMYKLLVGQVGVETVRGPVMVAKVAGIQMQMGLSNFLDFLGIISIGLGVINLLPIPVLDGGHLVYHLYEWGSGNKVSEFAEKIFVVIGVIVLLTIMSIAFYNDFIYW